VVEREVERRELAARKPAGLRGIVAPARFPADGDRIVENRDRVPPRIPPRVGVDASNAPDAYLDARFLAHLPAARLLGRLSHLAEASRQGPASPERRPTAADEEDPATPIAGPGVDRELRCFRSAATGHGRPL
jgi:hypothetical protein